MKILAFTFLCFPLICAAATNTTNGIAIKWPTITNSPIVDLTWQTNTTDLVEDFTFTLTYWDPKQKRCAEVVFPTADEFRRFISTLPRGTLIATHREKSTGRPDFVALGIRAACVTNGIRIGRIKVF